jgi:hypothetical protein
MGLLFFDNRIEVKEREERHVAEEARWAGAGAAELLRCLRNAALGHAE